MRIRALRTERVAGFRDKTYSLADARGAARIVVITGAAASGKTRFLDLLVKAKEAVAPYGLRPSAADVTTDGPSSTLALEWELSPAEAERAGCAENVTSEARFGVEVSRSCPSGLAELLGDYRHGPAPKLELFPEHRHLPRTRDLPPSVWTRTEDDERRLRPTAAFDKYAGLRGWLVEGEAEELARLAEQARATGLVLGARRGFREGLNAKLSLLAPEVAFAGIEGGRDGTPRALFAVRRAGGARVWTVELDDLSASQKDALLLAGTFTRLGLARSVVLLDRPELHLAPEHHGAFLSGLVALEESAQLVLATSSPTFVEAAGARIDLGEP